MFLTKGIVKTKGVCWRRQKTNQENTYRSIQEVPEKRPQGSSTRVREKNENYSRKVRISSRRIYGTIYVDRRESSE